MENWKQTLGVIVGEDRAVHFENYAGDMDAHLMNILRECGAADGGMAIDADFALSEIAQAADMARLMRDEAIKLMAGVKERDEADRSKAAEHLRNALARMGDKKSWEDIEAACGLLGVKLPSEPRAQDRIDHESPQKQPESSLKATRAIKALSRENWLPMLRDRATKLVMLIGQATHEPEDTQIDLGEWLELAAGLLFPLEQVEYEVKTGMGDRDDIDTSDNDHASGTYAAPSGASVQKEGAA